MRWTLAELGILEYLALSGRFKAAVNSLLAVAGQTSLLCAPTLFRWSWRLCASRFAKTKTGGEFLKPVSVVKPSGAQVVGLGWGLI